MRTVYALNTLASGAAPTILQRIIVGGQEREWAEYNFDAAHVVRYVSKERGRPFNWRRTTIAREVRELAQVPLLYANVLGVPDWTAEQWGKIRDYCFAGGTVILNFEEGAEANRDTMIAELLETFPEYTLKDLKDNDPLFATDGEEDEGEEGKEDGTGKAPEGMKVLGNGLRHFFFIPGKSWSCIWQLYQTEVW